MKYIIGLGNPGEEYVLTRHNAGAIILEKISTIIGGSHFSYDKYLNARIAQGMIAQEDVRLVFPQTFMNKSGESMGQILKDSTADDVVVMYDDLDLPFGSIRLSFNRGSGGHKGVDSIAHALKTRAFLRIRIGISPVSIFGNMKKPRGADRVDAYVLGNFKKSELKELDHIAETVISALRVYIENGREKAMTLFN